MPDDSDGYLEINLDDEEEGEGPDPGVLDLTLEPLDEAPAAEPPPPRPEAAAPRRPRRPAAVERQDGRPSASTPPEPAVPMTAGGVCPHCGYALRPLEEVCARCGRRADEPVEKPVEKRAAAEAGGPPEPLPAPEMPLAPPQHGYCLFTIAGAILLVALLVGVPLYLWLQPAQRARREYQEGLRAQLRQDFEGARAHYRRSLELDPRMALAAFAMGTTYLRIGSPAAASEMAQVTQQAMWGQTEALDQADRWFRQALEIGQSLPPSTRLIDQRISTPTRLRAFCHMCLGLTALVRYSAAVQAEQYDDAAAWMGVAGEEWQRAAGADPQDTQMRQMLGNPPGQQPGLSPGGTPGLPPGGAPPGFAPGFGTP